MKTYCLVIAILFLILAFHLRLRAENATEISKTITQRYYLHNQAVSHKNLPEIIKMYGPDYTSETPQGKKSNLAHFTAFWRTAVSVAKSLHENTTILSIRQKSTDYIVLCNVQRFGNLFDPKRNRVVKYYAHGRVQDIWHHYSNGWKIKSSHALSFSSTYK